MSEEKSPGTLDGYGKCLDMACPCHTSKHHIVAPAPFNPDAERYRHAPEKDKDKKPLIPIEIAYSKPDANGNKKVVGLYRIDCGDIYECTCEDLKDYKCVQVLDGKVVAIFKKNEVFFVEG
jgi:hypothetical protein